MGVWDTRCYGVLPEAGLRRELNGTHIQKLPQRKGAFTLFVPLVVDGAENSLIDAKNTTAHTWGDGIGAVFVCNGGGSRLDEKLFNLHCVQSRIDRLNQRNCRSDLWGGKAGSACFNRVPLCVCAKHHVDTGGRKGHLCRVRPSVI